MYIPRQNVNPPSNLSGVGSRNGARLRRMKFCAKRTAPPAIINAITIGGKAPQRHHFRSSFFGASVFGASLFDASAAFSGPFDSDL